MKRLRKIVATIFLVTFIVFYSLIVMALAVRLLPDAGNLIQFLFFTFFGLFWVIPAGFIIWLGWKGDRAIQPRAPSAAEEMHS